MKQEIRLGIIGLGQRGWGLYTGVLKHLEHIRVTAVCDLYEDRMDRMVEAVKENRGYEPDRVADYHELLAREDVDTVLIAASWAMHTQMACDAMKAGKAVACEVGGAGSLDDCWQLIHTYEQTGTPIMMLENCCYGRNELMILNMVRQGLFGEVVHCRGGYCHDLRDEVGYGREIRHYRLDNYLRRNCENYPTHEIGPIANVLNINRGNRFVSLYSMASKACGLNEFLRREKGDEYDLTNAKFAQGDMVTTLIKCAGGETIQINLETTTPRAYSRQFEVHGTKATYLEDNQSVYLDTPENKAADFNWKAKWGNIEELREQYEHPIWKKYIEEGVYDGPAGHDGIDWLVLNAFFDCYAEGKPMPIDVYDMATWMAITPLSENSIATGNTVYFPDFTGGKWVTRKPLEL
ncbi:MAG: Gfo/Idh/MocA family oxidoreductase [Clostridia bacterium]|nr:Gfo/Idh/MocA family oxidoreductase [Clostridia bacterium]